MDENSYSVTTTTTEEYYKLIHAGLCSGLELTGLSQIKPPPEVENQALNPNGSNALNPDDSQTINPEAT